MVLLTQSQDLVLGQAGEREHANLVCDVVPSARSLQLLEVVAQSCAHLDDAARHGAQVTLPLGEQLFVIEHCGSDAGTVRGRVGDLGALEDGELGGNALGSVLGVRAGGCDEVEAAGALAIQTKVLGVRLCDQELEALLDEVADGPVIGVQRAGGEALVCAVEEGELLPLLHDGGNLFPLVLSGVDARGVVCAGVEEDDAAFGCRPEGAEHAVKVEALGLLAEVWVVLDWEVHVGEDLVVVCPCWRAEVDGLGLGCGRVVEPLEEEATEVVGASTGDGLEGCDTLL